MQFKVNDLILLGITSQKTKIYSNNSDLYQATSCIQQPSVGVNYTQGVKK